MHRTIKVTCNVRLLLMEYIPGDSIPHLLKSGDYKKIPAEVRMDLVAQVPEAESALWHTRVSHGDLALAERCCLRKKRTSSFLLLLFDHHLLLPLGERKMGPKMDENNKNNETKASRSGVRCGSTLAIPSY